jgi:hypothetical protein
MILKITSYLVPFAIMTGIALVMIFALVYFAFLATAFAVWHPVVWPPFFFTLRLSLAVGMFMGVWFACSKQGLEMAKEFRTLFGKYRGE